MELEAALAENRARVNDFVAALRGVSATWTTPVRPGKWSPAEVAEHINLSYRGTAELVSGEGDAGFPRVPGFLRPLLRQFAFQPVLRTGKFGRPIKTFKSLTPTQPAADPDEAASRLQATLDRYESAVRSMGSATLVHPAFGRISAVDYVLFQAIHVRHHQAQLA